MVLVFTILTVIFALLLVALFYEILYGYIFIFPEYMKNDEDKEREIRNLTIVRTFFVISWFSSCAVSVLISFLFHVQKNSDTENIIFSILLFYGGFVGLIAKMGGLKIPIDPTSKLYYIINLAMISVSSYMFYNTILK